MLLLITLAFSFTGYLLPWDQLAYWAVTVGTDLVHYVPARRRQAPGPADRRPAGRPEHAAALLRAARRGAAVLAGVAAHGAHLARAQGRLRGRTLRASARSPRRRPSGPQPAPAAAAMAQADAGALRRAGPAAGCRRPRVGHRSRRPVDDTVFTWPHMLVRHVVVALGVSRGRARARRRVQPRRCAGSRTRTSRPSRPRRRGTSRACRSCSRTSTRSSPAS